VDLTVRIFQKMSTEGDLMERVKAFLRSADDRKCEAYAGLDQMISKLKRTCEGTLELDWLEEVRVKLGLGEKLAA